MLKFSRFYSATEAEAAAKVRRLFLLPTDHTPFRIDDAEQLAGILDGTTKFASRPRNDTNQPILRQTQSVQSVEQLLNVSGFSLSHEIVHRDKAVHSTSPSEDSVEWKIRSRTPSSDEPSPQKYRILSPALSVNVDALHTRYGISDSGLVHATEPTMQKHEYNWGQYADYHAIHPQDILQSMDTQFSKWSYDNNEGTTAIPFVIANASSESHARLVEVDKKLWVKDTEESMAEPADTKDTVQALIQKSLKQSSRGRPTDSKNAGQTESHTLGKENVSYEDKSISKRAALIAKSKAMKDTSLVSSKSVGQRRSAMHKNKNRRSIMPSPPPKAKKTEPVKNLKAQTKQSRPTIYVLNQGEDEQRREVDSALQNKRLDLDNRQQLEELMLKVGRAMTDREETTGGLVVEDVDEDLGKQVGKAHRLRDRVRKKPMQEAAR